MLHERNYLLFAMLGIDHVGRCGDGRQFREAILHSAEPLVNVLATSFELMRISQELVQLVAA